MTNILPYTWRSEVTSDSGAEGAEPLSVCGFRFKSIIYSVQPKLPDHLANLLYML